MKRIGELGFAEIAALSKNQRSLGGLSLSTPSTTSLEKLGFIFNGRGSSTDYASATAANTRQMLAEQKRTNVLLERNNVSVNV